jgi:hypothetical protein
MSEPEAVPSSQAASSAVSPPHSSPASRQNHDIPAAASTGHEAGSPGGASAGVQVVQPSTFLRRPRAISRPMTPSVPLSAVDKEQIEGLVSDFGLYDTTMHAWGEEC